MPTPYIYERQVEYWTSRGIENFFLDEGFELLVLPLTQLTEKDIPSDFLYLDTATNKLFGLQFKALYKNGDDHWNLDQHQHNQLQNFDWMYYGLSELKLVSQHRNALHYLRVASPSFEFRSKFQPTVSWQNEVWPNFGWAAFYESSASCRHGRPIRSRSDLQAALWTHSERAVPREISEIASEVFITNFDSRRAIRYSSSLGRLSQ